MKLLLTSAGFTTQGIIDKCVELCAKPKNKIKIAIINEGYAAEPGDHRWMIDELLKIVKAFPDNVLEVVSLKSLAKNQIKERLMANDVIFVVGGHTDYTMQAFNESGLTDILPEILSKKVYVGSSAGAMIIGKRVSSKAYLEVYGEEHDFGIDSYMDIVDFAIKPHLNSPEFPESNKDIFVRISATHNGVIYGLGDDSAVVVENGKIKIIGTDHLVIENGQLLSSN